MIAKGESRAIELSPFAPGRVSLEMKMSVRAYPLQANGAVPNNPVCPVLLYRGHANGGEDDLAGYFERLFLSHGWGGSWRNGIFDLHHWHNTAHEVLGVFSGEASVQFGGEGGPVIEAVTGDVVVVPAGVAHKRVSKSGRLGVVGAYAGERHPDMCTPQRISAELVRIVAAVPLPDFDPVYGANGPLFDHWRPAG